MDCRRARKGEWTQGNTILLLKMNLKLTPVVPSLPKKNLGNVSLGMKSQE